MPARARASRRCGRRRRSGPTSSAKAERPTRFDGTAWQSIAAPTDHDLLGVSGVVDAGVWAVGKNGTVLFRAQ
jgi:hypothetical protein